MLELDGADEEWLFENASTLPPRDFAVRFVARLLRRERSLPRRPNDVDRSRIIIRVMAVDAQSVQTLIGESSQLSKLLATPDSDPVVVFKRFSNLWRGFTNAALKKESLVALQTVRALIPSARAARKRVAREQKRARLRGSQSVPKQYGAAGERLKQIEERLVYLRANPRELGLRRLSDRIARQRMMRHLGPVMCFFGSDELEDIRLYIERAQPAWIQHPLRYMADLPLREWRRIHSTFRNGASREMLLHEVARRVPVPLAITDTRRAHAELVRYKFSDRSLAIDEFESTWSRGDYLSAVLVGITQTEGVLWDLAKHLNRRNYRIYIKERKRGKPGRFRYIAPDFDPDDGRRYRRKPNGELKTRGTISSARKLLELTKLGELLDARLYSYITDEFYEDRNAWAHGEVMCRDLKADAIGAGFGLRATMRAALRLLPSR